MQFTFWIVHTDISYSDCRVAVIRCYPSNTHAANVMDEYYLLASHVQIQTFGRRLDDDLTAPCYILAFKPKEMGNVSFLDVGAAKTDSCGITAANHNHVTPVSFAWSAAVANVSSSNVKIFAIQIGQVYACLYGALPRLFRGCLYRSKKSLISTIPLHLQATPFPSTASTSSSSIATEARLSQLGLPFTVSQMRISRVAAVSMA